LGLHPQLLRRSGARDQPHFTGRTGKAEDVKVTVLHPAIESRSIDQKIQIGLVVTPVPKVPFWKFRNFNVLQPNLVITS